jgi:hypothetical protein
VGDRAAVAFALVAALVAAPALWAQTAGEIAGRVRDASTGRGAPLARVTLDGGPRSALADSAGAYRLREVRAGRHTVRVELIGYRAVRRDAVLVRAGETTVLDVELQPAALQVDTSVVVEAVSDPVLDPLVTADVQRITAEEMRRLPLTTLEGRAIGGAGSASRRSSSTGSASRTSSTPPPGPSACGCRRTSSPKHPSSPTGSRPGTARRSRGS